MAKFVLRFGALLLVIGLLVGCGDADNSEETNDTNNIEETNGVSNAEETENNVSAEEQEETVVITISKDDGEEVITDKEIAIEEGDILIDVMEENFDIETEYDGTFITSIDGVAPAEGEEEEKGWVYFVNDEMALVGAAEYELTPGDEVTFDLQAWE